MLKTRLLKKTDLKNWPNISNVRFELIIDFTKNNEKSEKTLFRCDEYPEDRIDNILCKLTPDAFDRYQA